MKKFVIVEWEDASEEDAAWVDVEVFEDGPKPMAAKVFLSAGWLVRHTKTEVELTNTVEAGVQSGLIARRNRIPTGMVRSIKEIKLPARKGVTA